MDSNITKKQIHLFKCKNCGVEFMIYSDKEINEILCAKCKKNADNYKRIVNEKF